MTDEEGNIVYDYSKMVSTYKISVQPLYVKLSTSITKVYTL